MCGRRDGDLDPIISRRLELVRCRDFDEVNSAFIDAV